MFKILQKFLPEIINLLLTFYLQARQLNYPLVEWAKETEAQEED